MERKIPDALSDYLAGIDAMFVELWAESTLMDRSFGKGCWDKVVEMFVVQNDESRASKLASNEVDRRGSGEDIKWRSRVAQEVHIELQNT